MEPPWPTLAIRQQNTNSVSVALSTSRASWMAAHQQQKHQTSQEAVDGQHSEEQRQYQETERTDKDNR
eukprot:3773808-Amphidinium_carterae.1